jgi:lysophospholipase L1-like esterase
MAKRLVGTLCVALFAFVGTASADDKQPYLLALGDSLSIGIMPINGVYTPTKRGYADDLYAKYKNKIPGLKLAKLGCSGETTVTMMTGGVCEYRNGSQLQDALAFIASHRIAFITIDLGGDDLLDCFSLATLAIDYGCISQAGTNIATRLPQILLALRGGLLTSGQAAPIVGMNYYDAFLAAWIFGPVGQQLALDSLPLTLQLNDLLEAVYAPLGVPVANVEGAFHTTDWSVVPIIGLPKNVLIALTWTWMSAPPPSGPDVHPNTIGYGAIAAAFVQKLTGVLP